MADNEFEQNWQEDLYEDYVPVAYGRDDDQASQLVDILNDHEIPAEIGDTVDIEGGPGVPVLVPVDLLDEATEVIEEYEGLEGLVLADEEYEEEEEGEEGFEEIEEGDLFLGEEGQEEEEEEDQEEEEDEDKDQDEDDQFEDDEEEEER